MFTFSNKQDGFVNLNNIISIFIGKDGNKIVATDKSGKNWNIARYENREQCEHALIYLKNAFVENRQVYQMPSIELVKASIISKYRDEEIKSLKGRKNHGHGKS